MQNSEKSLETLLLTAMDATLRVHLTEKGAMHLNTIEKGVNALAKRLGLPLVEPKNYQQGAAYEAPISILADLEVVFGKNLWDNCTTVV